MSDKKLSEVIESYRTDRPDEWSMDIFIRGAEKLEAERDALKKTISQVQEVKARLYTDSEYYANDAYIALCKILDNQRIEG